MKASQRRALIIVMVINALTFAGMVVGSWVSGSSALLSGTLDNLGDALTYALSLAAVSAGALAKARVAMFKGILILCAAAAVAAQILWRLYHLEAPLIAAMGTAALLNLIANCVCLAILVPHRHEDINMSSVYECSRNDVMEGLAVLATVGGVYLTGSPWPDLLVATGLLVMFTRSALRVLAAARREVTSARQTA